MSVFDTAIVGGGIAGYTAALAAKNLKLNYIWLAEEIFSKKTQAAEYVRNFPAFTGEGRGFVEALEKQRMHEGVVHTPARVNNIYKMKEGFLLSAGEKTFSAKTVILCTGVELGAALKGEEDFLGKGVSYCAVCDGALYKNRAIAAVLSDERYAHEVEYLATFASTVHVFCPYHVQGLALENVSFHPEKPIAVEGDGRVQRLKYEGGEIAVDGVFFLRSATPPHALVGGLEHEGPHVKVGRDLSTNLHGLFAAGDVTGTPYQYVKAAGEGLTAAYSAAKYLRENFK